MSRNLQIIHCLRAPVGGLFRHVVDLALEQAAVGHDVGVIFDDSTVSDAVRPQLAQLDHACKLGVRSVKMPRLPMPGDIKAYREVKAFARASGAQILHGHGAKGGAYARQAAAALRKNGQRCLGFYTPHGGSLHYSPKSMAGRLFLGLERRLALKSSGIIFESAYSASIYGDVVGKGYCQTRVIPNGLGEEEFVPVPAPAEAAPFLFIGELRHLKGVDVLLKALGGLAAAMTGERGRAVRLAIVGDGPDMKTFVQLARTLGLNEQVHFLGRMPAREAFLHGHCVIVPSRAESLPYIVLEAAAAEKPLIATDVGGISEITGGSSTQLIAADDVEGLMAAMNDFLVRPDVYLERAKTLRGAVQAKFNIELMASQITDFYLAVLRR